MMRYFFDTVDGGVDTDTTGVELPDGQAAMREAVRYAGVLMADQPELMAHGRLDVVARGEDGKVVVRLRVELAQP